LIRGGVTLTSALVVVSLVVGPAAKAFANDQGGQDPQSIWIEAQRGNAEAQYRLGSYYERRYWLAERDPEIRGNPVDMVSAYALFSLAKSSNNLDALYGWHGTRYRVEEIFGNQERHEWVAALPEWLRGAGAPPSHERDPIRPGTATRARAQPETIDVPGQTSTANSERSAEPWSDPVHADLKTLLAQGVSYFDSADPVSARRLFELATERGSGEGAMLVAKTYDPKYIGPFGVAGLGPDIDMAATWYRKAIEMGNREAETRLQELMQRLEPASR